MKLTLKNEESIREYIKFCEGKCGKWDCSDIREILEEVNLLTKRMELFRSALKKIVDCGMQAHKDGSPHAHSLMLRMAISAAVMALEDDEKLKGAI